MSIIHEMPVAIRPLGWWGILMLLSTSLALTALGQPTWIWWFGSLSAICGYALFWRVSMPLPTTMQRFWLGTLWYTSVQFVQLSWSLSHPFLYIYPVYIAVSLFFGLQFGLLNAFVTPRNVSRPLMVLALAGGWTLLEFSRLFIFSGFSWNPSGLALSGSLYSLQMASLAGVYGLSFWVILVNLFALRAIVVTRRTIDWALWIFLAAFPYLFGIGHLHVHEGRMAMSKHSEKPRLTALLVQPYFPIEETMHFDSVAEAVAFTLDEWRHMLELLKPYQTQKIDLVVLPEYVVPFGSYWPIYSYEAVEKLFKDILGPASTQRLPKLDTGSAAQIDTPKGKRWFVSNAYLAQATANVLETELVAGLEDSELTEKGTYRSYSAALHFTNEDAPPTRYAKRVLVPMAEYIPLSLLASIAQSYGIKGSFTPGSEAMVRPCRKVPIGLSICYEETYGGIMRDNRLLGAEVLVNLTNDGWYPGTHLPEQHLSHARLRTVELGIPLIRSTNTGVTCAIDSLGREISRLVEGISKDGGIAGALKVVVPPYHYTTLYTKVGDHLIIGSSALFVLVGFYLRRRQR